MIDIDCVNEFPAENLGGSIRLILDGDGVGVPKGFALSSSSMDFPADTGKASMNSEKKSMTTIRIILIDLILAVFIIIKNNNV